MNAHYPVCVQIETSTRCNGACHYCPHKFRANKSGFMSYDLWRSVIDQLASWEIRPNVIAPFLTNEPFIDNRIFDWCAEVNRDLPQTMLLFFTNGTALKGNAAKQLMALKNIESIHFSFADINPDSHERLSGWKMDTALAAIGYLSEKHKVEVHIIKNPLANVEDLQRKYPKAKVIAQKPITWPYPNPNRSIARKNPSCNRHTHLCICHNGMVPLCCLDYDAKYAVGSALEEPLLDIYQRVHSRLNDPSQMKSKPCMHCES